MTISYIRPIVPDTTPGKVAEPSARAVGQPLPLIDVPTSRPPRQTNVLYRMATVDHRGRVADRHVTAALEWDAGTRLSIREHGGLLVVTADPHGVPRPPVGDGVPPVALDELLLPVLPGGEDA